MNRISEDLYPMRVNPSNFSRGDAVKKIYMDNIQTPYVGVVTRPIPSTNKVEVQWPHSMGMEDPWDLIKVNPVIDPPVVREDKAYKSYQNRAKEIHNCQHYNVLRDYFQDRVKPILLHASKLYNEGCSKNATFKILKANYDERIIIEDTLDKIFNDRISAHLTQEIHIKGERKLAHVELEGTSNKGFLLAYKVGDDEVKVSHYNSVKQAVESYKNITEIFESLDFMKSSSSIVSHINRIKTLEEDSDGLH